MIALLVSASILFRQSARLNQVLFRCKGRRQRSSKGIPAAAAVDLAAGAKRLDDYAIAELDAFTKRSQRNASGDSPARKGLSCCAACCAVACLPSSYRS